MRTNEKKWKCRCFCIWWAETECWWLRMNAIDCVILKGSFIWISSNTETRSSLEFHKKLRLHLMLRGRISVTLRGRISVTLRGRISVTLRGRISVIDTLYDLSINSFLNGIQAFTFIDLLLKWARSALIFAYYLIAQLFEKNVSFEFQSQWLTFCL